MFNKDKSEYIDYVQYLSRELQEEKLSLATRASKHFERGYYRLILNELYGAKEDIIRGNSGINQLQYHLQQFSKDNYIIRRDRIEKIKNICLRHLADDSGTDINGIIEDFRDILGILQHPGKNIHITKKIK